MTLTTLEPIQLDAYEFTPPCDDCEEPAEFTMRTICCPRLFCEQHKTALVEFLTRKAGPGMVAYCTWHRYPEVELLSVSDFILSVDPLS